MYGNFPKNYVALFFPPPTELLLLYCNSCVDPANTEIWLLQRNLWQLLYEVEADVHGGHSIQGSSWGATEGGSPRSVYQLHHAGLRYEDRQTSHSALS